MRKSNAYLAISMAAIVVIFLIGTPDSRLVARQGTAASENVEYGYSFPGYSENGITAEYIDVRYNDTDQLLNIEVATNNSAGQLANSFYFALTNGGFPMSNAEIAKIYFDATNPNFPKVSVYTYNLQSTLAPTSANYCANDPGSWWYSGPKQKYNIPDRIISSEDPYSNPLNFIVKTAQVSTDNTGKTRAVYTLQLSTRQINSHNPFFRSSVSTWKGVQFKEKLAFWGWLASGSTSAYFASTDTRPQRERDILGSNSGTPVGYLKDFQINKCTVLDNVGPDNKGIITNRSPRCGSITTTPAQPQPGDLVKVKVQVLDPENDPQQISFENLPAGMTSSAPNLTKINPVSGLAEVEFTWVPTASQTGKYSPKVKFKQDYGKSQASANCALELSIYKDNPPTCQTNNIEADLASLDAVTDSMANFARYLSKGIFEVQGTSSKITKLVEESDNLHISAWTTIWSIPKLVTTCVPYESSRCTTDSFTSRINSATTNLNLLNKNVTSILNTMKRALNSKCGGVKLTARSKSKAAKSKIASGKKKACDRARRTYTFVEKDSKILMSRFSQVMSKMPNGSHSCL